MRGQQRKGKFQRRRSTPSQGEGWRGRKNWGYPKVKWLEHQEAEECVCQRRARAGRDGVQGEAAAALRAFLAALPPGAGCWAGDTLLYSELGFSRLTEEAQKFRGEAMHKSGFQKEQEWAKDEASQWGHDTVGSRDVSLDFLSVRVKVGMLSRLTLNRKASGRGALSKRTGRETTHLWQVQKSYWQWV